MKTTSTNPRAGRSATTATAAVLSILTTLAVLTVLTGGAIAATAAARTDATGHGSFGLILAGGKGHLSQENADGDQVYLFAEPPEVIKVYEGGPSAGALEEGDKIVAVDGRPITGEDAAWVLQHPRAGRSYTLGVQRDGRSLEVTIRAGEHDGRRPGDGTVEVVTSDEDGHLRVVSYGIGNRVVRLSESAADRTSAARTSSWFGMGLEAPSMVISRKDDDHAYVYFDEPPRVYSVDPGSPAARAGILRGDELVKVDGLRLDEDAGGERWSVVAPGESVELLVLRDGELHTVELAAEEHPTGARGGSRNVHVLLADDEEDGEHLRYAGTLGDVDLEVRGIGDVRIAKGQGEIVIQSQDVTVRLTLRGR